MKLKIKQTAFILVICMTVVIFHERDTFNAVSAAKYITDHADGKSHNRCAWGVATAMHAGGQPVPLLRGCDYKWYFSIFLNNQFKELRKNEYTPQVGDVVVFNQINNHPYGHVAMWNGVQWVSDFKQRGMFPSRDYSENDYSLFRPTKPTQQ